MQLKHVRIRGYKNLVDATIEPEGSQIPLAIIGNNGTGKSNLIEALLNIFVGLYYNDPPKFDYELSYEAHGHDVEIAKNGRDVHIKVGDNRLSRSRFQEWARDSEALPPYPSLIFGYYSGTCDRVEHSFKRYRTTYSRKLKTQHDNLQRAFVFSTIDEAERTLLGLLAHDHRELLDLVNVRSFEVLRVELLSPVSYDRKKDDPQFWGTVGATRDFLADMDNFAFDSRGETGDEGERDTRTYLFHPDDFIRLGEACDKRDTHFGSVLQHLHDVGILDGFRYALQHNQTGVFFDFESLSEGEKQLLSVIGALTLSRQDECLILLDEPDTHLNPNWSWSYYELLSGSLMDGQRNTSSVLLATHDPVLISGLTKEQVLIAGLNAEGGLEYHTPFRDPKGQGVANVLTSEFFGLPSSLDKATQDLLDRRLVLQYTDGRLTPPEVTELSEINVKLEDLGLTISFRDPTYIALERQRAAQLAGDQ